MDPTNFSWNNTNMLWNIKNFSTKRNGKKRKAEKRKNEIQKGVKTYVKIRYKGMV